MPIAIPAAIVAGKLISKFMKGKAASKQAKEQRAADVARLTLQQKMGEDKRIGRAQLGNSILSGIGNKGRPGAAYGGRVDFNTNIDPSILEGLFKERTYDFSKTVGDTTKGAGWDMAGGMVGDAASALGSAYGTGAIGGGGSSGLMSGLYGGGGSVPTSFASPESFNQSMLLKPRGY